VLNLRRYQYHLLWLCGLLLLVAVALYPVSNRMTKVAGLALASGVWIGAIALFWRHASLRMAFLGLTAAAAALLLLPGRALPATETLRADYVSGLQRYEGSRYVWGGENVLGIDCSGLVRRGFIDALLTRGVRTFHPGLTRQAFSLWWNDCTAATLGKGEAPLTQAIVEAASINTLDHTSLLAGDLAVTKDGLHILGYLGDSTWLEADPIVNRVIRVRAPSAENVWLKGPVRIVRWRALQPPPVP
jgi:hypothetical protein